MLGDLQRIWIYGRRGWSAPQRLPGEVMAAFTHLKRSRIHAASSPGGRVTVCFHGEVILPDRTLPDTYVLCEYGRIAELNRTRPVE